MLLTWSSRSQWLLKKGTEVNPSRAALFAPLAGKPRPWRCLMPGISACVPREKWKRGERVKLGSCLTETSSEKSEFCLEINHSVFITSFSKNLIFPIGSQTNVSQSEIKSNCVRKVMLLHPSWETNATHISSWLLFPFSFRGLCFALTPAVAQMYVR